MIDDVDSIASAGIGSEPPRAGRAEPDDSARHSIPSAFLQTLAKQLAIGARLNRRRTPIPARRLPDA